ncbi:MAG: MSEP-CTERM sorting domain-containing protein [Kiritimatiellae bacterium]|nr:MSEP-CTERM sorting domain-containing protein [Kiritimatiellia bacterium]
MSEELFEENHPDKDEQLVVVKTFWQKVVGFLFRRKERTSALSDDVKHPWMLFWVMLVPQLLLLFLNTRAWQLIRGEVNPEQFLWASQIFYYEVVLLLSAGVAWITLHRLKRFVGLIFCAFVLFAEIGYLWFFTVHLERIIPNTVTEWMLPGSQLFYYQYALMMPSLFYAALRLACFPVRLNRAVDVGLSVLALVLVPTAWFAGMHMAHWLFRVRDPSVIVMIILSVGSTVILLMAFLRILAYSYMGLRRLKWGRVAMLIVAGLIAPVGGLILNHHVSFPYDFQSKTVYVLTGLNALFLLLPFSEKSSRGVAAWCLRSALYPFTLYFFVVFLPFLPLALPALFAFGAGFLILAPTLLFIVHTRTLFDEGKVLAAGLGTTRVVVLFSVCVAIIPLGYTGRAIVDKLALSSALDVAYRPDYETGNIPVYRSALKRTLLRLHAIKQGNYLPFITDWYDHIVLDGMILPDRKAQHIETMFFGGPLQYRRVDSSFRDLFGSASRRRRNRNRNRVRLPSRNVQLAGWETKISESNNTTTATVVLSLENKGGTGSEYVADLTVPDGVVISGYWLHIGEERVPGRIFEKKAAMWVYHMIRDRVRRDPGMLVYTGNNQIRLNVFPFAAKEWRTTEIAFSFPTGLSPHIRIGSEEVALAEEQPKSDNAFLCKGSIRDTLVIPSSRAAALPAVQRQSYVHFVVDFSEAAETGWESITQTLVRVSDALPTTTMCRVTLANYEFAHATPDLVSLKEVPEVISRNRDRIPFRGALCPERAMKSALLTVRDMPTFGPDNVPMAPVFVVLRAEKTRPLREGGFGPFADIVPDVSAYYEARSDGRFDVHAFEGGSVNVVPSLPSSSPVILLRADTAYALCRPRESSVVRLPADMAVEYYDAETKNYILLEKMTVLSEDALLSQGLALLEQWEKTVFQPALEDTYLSQLVQWSREVGILIPVTSYIVVENSAQWEMLKRAEKKSLKADKGLEFDEFVESPAPSMLLLLPIVFLLPVIRRRSRRKTEGHVEVFTNDV